MKKILLLFISTLIISIAHSQNGNRVDSVYSNNTGSLISKYLNAETLKEKKKTAKKLVKSKADFETVYEMLSVGKLYAKDVKTGLIEINLPALTDKKNHYSLIYIPLDYDPKKKYSVRIRLHGGVTGTEERGIIDSHVSKNTEDYKDIDYILVYPAAWAMALWWSEIQTENISNIITYLKKNYNIDENSISLSGCSDGGTGTFYFSNTIPTQFSNFSTSVGYLPGLSNIKKEFYPYNLTNKAILAVNAKNDEIFRAEFVDMFSDLLKKNKANFEYIMVDTAGHTCRWCPELNDKINKFIISNKREPYPDTIRWQSENDSIYNQYHWYIMNTIGDSRNKSSFIEKNAVLYNNAYVTAFSRKKPSGTAQITKSGNIVYVKTKGISEYTLLLSPDHFNFNDTLSIYTNDLLSFQGIVSKDLKTLLSRNIQDNDRSMLFGAEINIRVDKKFKK